MTIGPTEGVLLAWPAVVVALFRAIGPRRAALVGAIGGLLFLPGGQFRVGPPGLAFPVDKWNSSGLALILGVAIFDRGALRAARPRWPDLPILAYYLAPLIGLASGVPGSAVDVLDLMIGRGLGWVVPYAIGRIYFGGVDGPRAVEAALVVGGLSYIPVCLYEEVAGPSRYLMGLVYGVGPVASMVERLGGYRPEGFLGNGLTVAAWMASTAVMAAWLALGGRRLGRWPGWPSALALFLATISCRGVYGYLLGAIGLSAALLTRGFRTRAVLVALLIVPVLYMGLRGSGAWDGQVLERLGTLAGRPGTVGFRLKAEDEVIRRVVDRNPAFGFGTYVWHAEGIHWPDGAWLHALWMGGLLGLAVQLLGLHVIPSGLALSVPPGRPGPDQAASASWALACWCVLQMVDGIHNNAYFTTTALVAGSLVGSWDRRGAVGTPTPPTARAAPARSTGRAVPIVATAVALILVEILGRSTRDSPTPPDPPSLEDGPRANPP